MPNNVKTIFVGAFSGCSGLRRVTIGRSVTWINQAFSSCDNIKSVICRAADPPSQFGTAFSCYDTATLYVPRSSYHKYTTAEGWKEFQHIYGISVDYEPDDFDVVVGDTNGDGETTLADLNRCIHAIIDGCDYDLLMDVNNDGAINIADVNCIVDCILNDR